MRRNIIKVTTIAIAAAIFFAAAARAEILPGAAIGALKLKRSGGGVVDLGKVGKPYILAFFVANRADDTKQLAALKNVVQKKEFAAWQVIAITRGKDAGEQNIAAKFLAAKKLPYTLVFDSDSIAARKFGALMFPMMFLVDEKGVLRTIGISSVTENPRRLSFEDFLRYVKAKKDIPFIDMMSQGTQGVESAKRLVGKTAPDFSLPDMRGNPRSLSTYRGRSNVVLVFWRSTCPHCRAELPKIQNFYINHRADDNFEVLAVTNPSAATGGIDNVKEVVRESMLTFPILLEDDNMGISKMFGVMAVPSMFFINKKGVIVDYIAGDSKYFNQVYSSIFSDPARLGRK